MKGHKKEMKYKINSKVTSILIIIAIVSVLFLSGPANAVIPSLEIPIKQVVQGTNLNIMPVVQIESIEIADIDSIELRLIKNTKIIECKFLPNGTPISGCEGISVNLLNIDNQSFYGYGYGLKYKPEAGYGYGYGYMYGYLKYNLSIATENFEVGKYKTEIIVNVGETKFKQKGEDITIEKILKLNTRCSIRAFDGTFNVDSKEFSNNKIRFYISSKNDINGDGSLSGQKDRDRFSYRFKVDRIIENNETNLVFNVSGVYRIGRDGIQKNIPEKATLNFDRIGKKISITGDKVKIKSMTVNFIKGCDSI